MLDLLMEPWPWYVAGPVLGLALPALLLAGNRVFGVSSNFRHVCAAGLPCRADYFRYDWRSAGLWNMAFGLGIVVGGYLAGGLLANPEPVAIAEATRADLAALGITDFGGLVPRELFSWGALLSPAGLVLLGVGGFLVGFGTAYAGGCTSGHGISGLADLQAASLIAVVAFFAGGILCTHLLLPLVLGGSP
ncbi:MAG: YeeE/YedE family protein [Gemmatimonadetes bacterium]|nr:YeeE/YedE family protein [Gemmatimonadota bacterium]